jgi:hypothetical protein
MRHRSPALSWIAHPARAPSCQHTVPAPLKPTAVQSGYGALVAVSVTQTAAGRAPFDLGPAIAALSLLGVALLGAAYVAALLALRHGGLHLTTHKPRRRGPAKRTREQRCITRRCGQAAQPGGHQHRPTLA